VVLLIAAFAVGDMLLLRFAMRHRSEAASQLFEQGNAAKAAGRIYEALELFRAAHNQSSSEARYYLAFAQALRLVGREGEARGALEDLLNRYPANGDANAEMARALARASDWQQAAWYYHRALYGEWKVPEDLLALRFELADRLARHGAREQLLSEVVLLNASIGESGSRHLSHLQLAAGDWERAEQSYRSLVQANPADPALLIGLARAQSGMGKYLAAERTFRRALNAGSTDTAVVKRTGTANKHQSGRSNPSRSRERREAQAKSCSAEDPRLAQPERILAAHRPARAVTRSTEQDLEIFEHLWSVRNEVCGGPVRVPPQVDLIARQLSR
jgi:tetratricopeptide (TPR) repeat protein